MKRALTGYIGKPVMPKRDDMDSPIIGYNRSMRFCSFFGVTIPDLGMWTVDELIDAELNDTF